MTGASRRTRRVLAAAAVLSAAVAAGALALSHSGSPSRAAASTIPPGQTTTRLSRRTLSEGETVDGTLGYGAATNIYAKLGGIFTWLPATGQVIGRGGTLYRLDDLPVVLMYGSVPAYRRLAQGMSDGPDVAQLNRNLAVMGYDSSGTIAGSDSFSAATAAAVRRWQSAEGLPETGVVVLGRVTFAPAALRVTAVHVSLGQDPPGASEAAAEHEGEHDGSGSESDGKDEPQAKDKAEPEHEQKHPQAKSSEPSKGGEEQAAPEKGKPDKEGSEQEDGQSPEEQGGGAGELALSATSTRQVVTVEVKAEQQQLARVGEHAPVTLPNGRTVTGRVIDVGTVASSGSEEEKQGSNPSEGETATITVTLALRRRVPRLDQAPVSVELVKSVSRHVLTVPAAALGATAGGGYVVKALREGRVVAVAVTPGQFADGYVAIEGRGVHEGMTVLEPR